jgi:glyoxylase-like metal-dependent hydrolase (beta-lactamase superfamily II)
MPVLRRRTVLASALAVPAAQAGWTPQPAQASPVPLAGQQAPSFFRYRVGALQVTAVHDGMAYRSLDGFVPNAPPGAVQQALADAFLTTDRFPITFTTLVINTGRKLVLIDTGNGDLGAPTAGTWMANFRAAGFTPDQVDTVVVSHFHADHVNGFRLKDGTAVFPNAEIMVPEAEWAFWTSASEAARAPAGLKPNFDNVARVFGPVKDHVTPYAWDKEILPGITAIKAEGHTPGHTCFAIVSDNARLLVMSDITNQPLIFARHPEWSAVFDQDAAAARATRRRMLDLAAAERMQVSFYHASFPATGHIEREGDGYRLAPVLWNSQA